VRFLDKEKVGLADGDRSLIYDILCQTDNGEYIIVEMQNKPQPYFKKRSIYYLSRSVVEQGERGDKWHYDIKAIYLVALLNFKLPDISRKFRTDVALMDMKDKTLFSTDVRMIYLQLPYFVKEADECNTIFERIIFVLKNMDILQRMPWLAQDAVFKRLSEIAEVSALSKEERQQYDTSLRHYRDTIAVMEGQFMEGERKGRAEGRKEGRAEGRAEGRKEGRAEGRAEGRKEGLILAARQMRRLGVPDQDIINSLHITPEDLKRTDIAELDD
jgi:predicted transposase/invertase (TIGR01784 family)